MSVQAIRPARLWYWVAGAALVAAVVWLALGLFLGFRSLPPHVTPFPLSAHASDTKKQAAR